MKVHTFIPAYLVAIHLQLCTSTGTCPPTMPAHCICVNGTVAVTCIGNIKELPTGALDAELLTVKEANIDIIGTVPQENLCALTLENNHIRYIKDYAFKKLDKLKYLYLKNNEISGINNRTLSGLVNLRTVTLSLNPLYVLRRGVFHNTPNIKEIMLEESHLYTIESKAFSLLRQLVSLKLSYNYLKRLPTFNKLDELNSLNTIDLSGNQIESISGFGLGNLRNLQHLYLHKNQIHTITAEDTKGLDTSLIFLDLSHNKISDIEPVAFVSMNSLGELNLQHNHITNLTWEEMPMVSKLNLAGNPWDCSCQNSWMVEDINKSIRRYNDNPSTLCATPESAANKPVFQVPMDTFKCPNPAHHAVKTSLLISLGVIFSLAVLISGAVCCQIISKRRRKNDYNQPYVKVTANGGIHM